MATLYGKGESGEGEPVCARVGTTFGALSLPVPAVPACSVGPLNVFSFLAFHVFFLNEDSTP